MSYINDTQTKEDPYYWRNKIISWRAFNELDNRDSTNPSDIIWTEVVGKEKLQNQSQNQSSLNKLWYKEGMQIDLSSNTAMAESLKTIINHIKDIADEAKKSGNYDILQGITDEPAEFLDNSKELKALAVSALAEADGNAPEAKKILDQVD